MTTKQYIDALHRLKLTPYAAGKVLGISISIRQSHRYASGEQTVSEPVASCCVATSSTGCQPKYRRVYAYAR